MRKLSRLALVRDTPIRGRSSDEQLKNGVPAFNFIIGCALGECFGPINEAKAVGVIIQEDSHRALLHTQRIPPKRIHPQNITAASVLPAFIQSP